MKKMCPTLLPIMSSTWVDHDWGQVWMQPKFVLTYCKLQLSLVQFYPKLQLISVHLRLFSCSYNPYVEEEWKSLQVVPLLFLHWFFFYLIVMQMPGVASKLLKSSLHQMLSNFDMNFKECDTHLPTSSLQTQSSGHYIFLIKMRFFAPLKG